MTEPGGPSAGATDPALQLFVPVAMWIAAIIAADHAAQALAALTQPDGIFAAGRFRLAVFFAASVPVLALAAALAGWAAANRTPAATRLGPALLLACLALAALATVSLWVDGGTVRDTIPGEVLRAFIRRWAHATGLAALTVAVGVVVWLLARQDRVPDKTR